MVWVAKEISLILAVFLHLKVPYFGVFHHFFPDLINDIPVGFGPRRRGSLVQCGPGFSNWRGLGAFRCQRGQEDYDGGKRNAALFGEFKKSKSQKRRQGIVMDYWGRDIDNNVAAIQNILNKTIEISIFKSSTSAVFTVCPYLLD